jgi:hypothetical protein
VYSIMSDTPKAVPEIREMQARAGSRAWGPGAGSGRVAG